MSGMQIQLPEQNLQNDRPDGMMIPSLNRPDGMSLSNGVIARVRKTQDGTEIFEYMTKNGSWEIGNMKEIESRPYVNMWEEVSK
jgi:hypothetical protein